GRGRSFPSTVPVLRRKHPPVPFAICNEIYEGWSLADTCAHAARVGYDAIELAPFTLASRITDVSAAERARIRGTVEGAGLRVAGLHWLLARTEGFHVTHPDAATRRRTAEYLRELVDACADLGGSILVFGSPKQRSLQPGVAPGQAWEWATQCLADAVRQAEDRGVTFCVEPLAPSETDFLNTAAEARRFAAQFGSSAMKIILDVKAMSSEATPIPQIIRESAGQFAHFHANDPNLKGPGFGTMDFKPIAECLRQVDYRGYVSVEVFVFEEGAEVIARQSRENLRAAFGQ
ncbi:MAG: sugar phosphate isomerase/epimerase, partial [Nitrospira sp.]|nr:sugar phosphate isomerase/epimerase [Nitrospira sp.]